MERRFGLATAIVMAAVLAGPPVLKAGDPPYTLHVVPTLGGYVTGPGIDCGDGGRTDCDETYASPTTVTLEAFTSSGYQFLAWGGNCADGNPTASVIVDDQKRCDAVFSPIPSGSAPADPSLAQASLYVESLGIPTSPSRAVWVGADSTIAATGSVNSGAIGPFAHVSIRFTTISSGADILLRFNYRPPDAVDFEQEYTFDTSDMTLMWGNCASSLSRFRVYQMSVDTSGQLIAFAADFEARCLEVGVPTGRRVVGAVRFNSGRARLVPYDGAYPIFKLNIEPAGNGIVSGPDVNCGPGRTDCTETYPAATSTTLEATPLPGYRFLGWSGGCAGPAITTVAIEWVHTCRAFFRPIVPGPGPDDERLKAATLLIESEPGDPIGQGRGKIWLNANIDGRSHTADFLGIRLGTADGIWQISFSAPNGQPLQPGAYENAAGYTIGEGQPTTPRLMVRGPSGQCSTSGSIGRFVIYEITMFIVPPGAPDEGDQATSLAVDFEIRCSPGGPALRGAIRLKSSRAVLAPFAPAVFTPAPMPATSDFDGDGLADLAWRHTPSGRNAVWLMDGVNARVTAVLSPAGAGAVADLDWEIRGVADMNRDGRPDLIWQHRTSGRLAVWFMSGTTRTGTNYLYDTAMNSTEPDLDWKIVAAGDMDRDGHTDLLWRHRVSGAIRLWHMNGLVKADSVVVPTVADAAWEIVDLADMNGDGMLDLVWWHNASGRIAAWLMFDAIRQSTPPFSPAQLADSKWQIAGVADMNGDRKPDLVWQQVDSGELGVWFLDGLTQIGGRYLNPPRLADPRWRIVGVR